MLENTKTYGELINLGSAQEISINNLAKEICKLTGSKSEIDYLSYEAAYGENFEDMQRRVPDVSKLHRLTGYHFKYNLHDTLTWIHDEMKSKLLPPSRTLSQINVSPLASVVEANGEPPVGSRDVTL